MKDRITVFPTVPQTITVMAVIDISTGDSVTIDGSGLVKVTKRVYKGLLEQFISVKYLIVIA